MLDRPPEENWREDLIHIADILWNRSWQYLSKKTHCEREPIIKRRIFSQTLHEILEGGVSFPDFVPIGSFRQKQTPGEPGEGSPFQRAKD